MSGVYLIALVAVVAVAGLAAAVFVVRTRRVVATPTERAVHDALHTASLAARALRQGLDRSPRGRPRRSCASSPAPTASPCSTATAGCSRATRPTTRSGKRRHRRVRARRATRSPASAGC